MKFTRKHIVVGAMALVIGAAAVVQVVWHPLARSRTLAARPVQIDLTHPDALIDSHSLSQLPRDILRVPLLRDVLTEDFVAYYEDNDERLSLRGTLRRLAYEKQLDGAETVLKHVFDEPARVMLWRGPDDKLRYWVLSMQRNGLAKALEAVAKAAVGDTQLSKVAGALADAGVPLYALKLSPSRSILIASRGDRLVAVSEPGLLLDEQGQPMLEPAKALAGLLSDDDQRRNLPGSAYALPASDTPGHRVVVGVDYLSFGYRQFFPGIEAVRFDFGVGAAADSGWEGAVLLDPQRPSRSRDNTALWRALPADPAACVALPMDGEALGPVLRAATGEVSELSAAAAQAAHALAGPAAVCWYGKSALVAPLFVAQLSSPQQAQALKPLLGRLFGHVVGAYEAKVQAASDTSGGYKRLPVTSRAGPAGATLWQRPVSARYGTAVSADAPFAAQLSAERYFPVTLALAGEMVVFSPDAGLVDDALAVLAKQYPAVADRWPNGTAQRTLLTVTPAMLAPLLRREVGQALPAAQEAVFLGAAQTHLFPKLAALARYAPLALALQGDGTTARAWVPLVWSSGAALKAQTSATPLPATATPGRQP